MGSHNSSALRSAEMRAGLIATDPGPAQGLLGSRWLLGSVRGPQHHGLGCPHPVPIIQRQEGSGCGADQGPWKLISGVDTSRRCPRRPRGRRDLGADSEALSTPEITFVRQQLAFGRSNSSSQAWSATPPLTTVIDKTNTRGVETCWAVPGSMWSGRWSHVGCASTGGG